MNTAFSADDLQIVRPELLLPVQFFGVACKHTPHQCGELRLLVALLEDAIHCFQHYAFARDACGRRLFAAAEHWIMEQEDQPDSKSFSFEYVCAVLDLDPDCLRQGLQRWKEGSRRRFQPSRFAAVTQLPRRALHAARLNTGEDE